MTVDINAINHICNTLRRQTLAEFPDLTLHFVIFEKDKKADVLRRLEEDLNEHVAGKAATKHFRRHKNNDKTGFLGLTYANTRSLFRLKPTSDFIAMFFVSMDDFDDLDSLRHHIYHQLWHALSLYQNYKAGHEEKFTREDDFITPNHKDLGQLSQNMMADAFYAVINALQTGESITKSIATYRAEATLTQQKGKKPELFPFPIAMETTDLVYDELKDLYSGSKGNMLTLAVQMTKEVGITHKEASLKQWKIFSLLAQEMAWLGYDVERILSAGSYTSEDPYVRTTAYIIAEILETDPKPWGDFKTYNPFADAEMNERVHLKACDHAYKNLITHIVTPQEKPLFKREGVKRNIMLLKGHVQGWCVPALLAASNAFEGDDIGIAKENAATAFDSAKSAVPWDVLKNLSRTLMLHRRRGDQINTRTIKELASQNPDLKIVADMFDAAPPDTASNEDNKDQSSD